MSASSPPNLPTEIPTLTHPLGAPAAPDPHLSPSIQRSLTDKIAAYELKYLISREDAARVEAWAAQSMQPDVHANPLLGGYQTTTLYLDTPNHDVLLRADGFRRRKFRLRRYGSDRTVFLERKTRQGHRVEKRRSHVPLADLATLASHLALESSPAHWFVHKTTATNLLPACRVTYNRNAFVVLTESGPLRLTLDRNIRGTPTTAWDLTPIADPTPSILHDQVICEFKFRGNLPRLFKDLITHLNLTPGKVSKYRRLMALHTGGAIDV